MGISCVVLDVSRKVMENLVDVLSNIVRIVFIVSQAIAIVPLLFCCTHTRSADDC